MQSTTAWLIGGLVAAEATGVTNFTGSGDQSDFPDIPDTPEIDISGATGGLSPGALSALVNAGQSAPTLIESGGGLDASTVREIVESTTGQSTDPNDYTQEWPENPFGGSDGSGGGSNTDADRPESDGAGGSNTGDYDMQDTGGKGRIGTAGAWLGELGHQTGQVADIPAHLDSSYEAGKEMRRRWESSDFAGLGGGSNDSTRSSGGDSGGSNSPLGSFGVKKLDPVNESQPTESNIDRDSGATDDPTGGSKTGGKTGGTDTEMPQLSQSPTGTMIDKLDRLANQ